MKLKDIYALMIREGMRADPRKRTQVQASLTRAKNLYRRTKGRAKKFFDTETLRNPYADTRLLFGTPNQEIHRVMIGIDIGVGELLLADKLSAKGTKIDLVISHHPEGQAWAGFFDVMSLQTDVFVNLGVDPKAADAMMRKRIDKVARRVHGSNHGQVVDAARLLNIPFMSCHTPADNHVASYLQKLMGRKKPTTLGKLVDLLLAEPEYQEAARVKAGPKILSGKPEDKAGKVFVDMTGGTQGAKEIFSRLAQIGFRTVLGMHFSEDHYDKMRDEQMSVVTAGHMASDSLGLNLLWDKIDRTGKIDLIECSGFRRYQR